MAGQARLHSRRPHPVSRLPGAACKAFQLCRYTAFTVTVDARRGISTGISAADRALTLRMLADPAAAATDFRRPGHIFPLRCARLVNCRHLASAKGSAGVRWLVVAQ